jgi:holo-[acyl-carrier protein] synthase
MKIADFNLDGFTHESSLVVPQPPVVPGGWIVGCGMDVVEIEQFERHLSLGGQRFLRRIYTPHELAYSEGRTERLAARFAAKEAASKALGTGMRSIRWTDIEVLNEATGKPFFILRERALETARERGISSLLLTMTHTPHLAVAYVLATGQPGVE